MFTDTIIEHFSIDSGSNSNEVPTFRNPPPHVSDFMKNQELTVLVFKSSNVDLLCKWVSETIECAVVDRLGFAKLCETKGKWREGTPLAVLQINEEEFSTIASLAHEYRYKCILVVTSSSSFNVQIPCHVIHFHWSDLTPTKQIYIQEAISWQLGISPNDTIKALESLESCDMAQVLLGRLPNMLKCDIPEQLPYYIERRLQQRKYISEKVLQMQISDIFVISGMENPELFQKIKGTTISSGSIYQTIHSRFIILESPAHLKRIIELRKNQPVHCFEWKQDRFAWIKSFGSVSNLQMFIVPHADNIIREADLLIQYDDSEISSSLPAIKFEDNGKPVCISDTPGMGKSVLLSQLARYVQEKNASLPVIFLSIVDLIHAVKSYNDGQTTNTNTADALLDLVCANKLARAWMLANAHAMRHIFLDSLDELDQNDFDFAIHCFRSLMCEFTKSRLWITTRPHLLLKLEAEFSTFGYNILPLETMDQIIFLQKFWTRSETNPTIEKLKQFASRVLKSIKSLLTEDGNLVAGIPLQCMLIGLVYEDQALEFYHENSPIPDDMMPKAERIDSITDLFTLIILSKIRKFKTRYQQEEVDTKRIQDAHAFLSFELLFPSSMEMIRRILKIGVTTTDLYNVGILQSGTDGTTHRFIHRTFAEYFVARTVVDQLVNPADSAMKKFIISSILEITSERLVVRDWILGDVSLFRNDIICYFMNSMLNDTVTCVPFVRVFTHYDKIFMGKAELTAITEACFATQCINIFRKVFYYLIREMSLSYVFSKRIFIILTAMTPSTLIEEVLHMWLDEVPDLCTIEVGCGNASGQKTTLLHVGVVRGNYSTVEALLVNYGFLQFVTRNQNQFLDLYKHCIQNTKFQSKRRVKDRKLIIHLLHKTVPFILQRNISDGNYPGYFSNSSEILFYSLVDLFGLIDTTIVKAEVVENTIRWAACTLDLRKFFELLYRTSEKGGERFIAEYSSQFTMIRNEILENDNEAAFLYLSKFVRFRGHAMTEAILYCVKHQCHNAAIFVAKAMDTTEIEPLVKILVTSNLPSAAKLIADIVRLGANVDFRDEHAKTPLMHVKHSSFVPALIKGGAKVNAVDKCNRTALHYAISLPPSEGINIVRELCEWGANTNLVDTFGMTPIMRVTDYDIIQPLSELGFKLNRINQNGNTLLHDAVLSNNPSKVLNLLEAKTPVDIADASGRTPLMVAKSALMMELLLKNNANVNLKDNQGQTALHHLVERPKKFLNKIEAIKALVENGADINEKNLKGQTPLMQSTADAMCLLLESGADVNMCDIEKATPLHYAVGRCVTSSCSKDLELLIQYGANVNAVDKDGMTALMIALHEECIRILLRGKADVNMIRPNQRCAFYEFLSLTAYGFDNIDISELISAGADVNTPLHMDKTPIMVAQRPEHFRKLLENGAIVTATEEHKESLLYRKMVLEQDELVELLLNHGVNTNAVDNKGNTILHSFVDVFPRRRMAYLPIFLQKSYDVNLKNSRGETLLMMSCHPDVIDCLLNAGAVVNIRDNEGNTALHHAVKPKKFISEMMRAKVVQLLISKGADVNIKNHMNENALTISNGMRVIKILSCCGAGRRRLCCDDNNEDRSTPIPESQEFTQEIKTFLLKRTTNSQI